MITIETIRKHAKLVREELKDAKIYGIPLGPKPDVDILILAAYLMGVSDAQKDGLAILVGGDYGH